MAIEQALGIRLTLVAQMGNAAKELSGELNAVADSLRVVRDLGKQFDLSGITQLNNQVTSLNQRASAAAEKVAALKQNIAATGEAAQGATSGISNAASAADRVKAAASGAAQSVINMGDAMTRTKEAGSALALLHTDFELVEQSAGAAATRVNAFADAVLRLAGAQRLALTGESAYTPRYGPIERPAYSGPAFVPLPGGDQYALPSGDGPRYGPIPQPANRSSATAALSSAEMLALTGGTDPNFNSRAWWANQRAQGTSAGSGPTIGVPPGGFGGGGGGFWNDAGGFFGGAGGGMSKFGDKMQSQGWALAVNGGIMASMLGPALKNAMDLQDLLARTVSAMREDPSVAKKFNENLMKAAEEVGTPLRDSIAGGYTFVSSLPHGFNLSSKQGQQAAAEMYKTALKLALAGGSSAQPFAPSDAAFDMNTAFVQHFNLSDASDPQKMVRDYKQIADAFMNVENTTATTAPMIGQSLKAMGPLAEQMGMSFEQTMTFIAAMAAGGVRGSAAGYAGKRILSKEAAPSGKLATLQKQFEDQYGINLSLYQGGSPRDFYKFIETVGNVEQHLPKQVSAKMNYELSGLYAISQFDQLVNFVHKFGGAEDMKKYGEALTAPGSLDRAVAKRTKDNPKIAATQADTALQIAEMDALKSATPFLIQMFHAIRDLANGFSHLSPGMQKFITEGLLIGTVFSVIAGGALIVLGNFIKFAGVVFQVIGVGAKFVAWLGELASEWGLGEAAAGAFTTALEFAGGALATIAGVISAPVVAIGALIAAIGMGVVAWVKDWGNIREKTASVVQWLGQEIPKIPEQIGYGLTRAAIFMLDFGFKWLNFWEHFPETAYNGIKFVVGYLVENVPKWADAGLKAIEAWGNAIIKALPGIGSAIMGGVDKVLNVLNPVTWVKAGVGLAQNFTKGIVQGIKDGKPQVKDAQQQVRNLFPGSEPKDASSPLYGMGKSGQAFSNNFIEGILDGFKKSKTKVKKAISDVFVDLRGESVAEVEKTARAIEDALAKQGAVIKNRWMDLMTGGHVTRFYGDAAAVRMAIKQDKGPDPLKSADDYLRRLGEYPQNYQQIMAKLHAYLRAANAAELTHEVSMIDALIARVQKAHDAALTKLGLPFVGRSGHAGMFGQIDKAFAREGNKGDAFDALQQKDEGKLQRMIEMRQNQELPTIKELNNELTLEISERDALQKIYKAETEERQRLVRLIGDALTKANQINATDQKSRDLKAQLIADAQAYQDQLDTLNDRLDGQVITINKLDKAIQDYTTQIRGGANATAEWAHILDTAFTQAGNDALKALGDSLSNGIDTMLSRVFGAKRSGIAGFVGSFFADIFSNIAHSLVSLASKQLSADMTASVMGFFSRMFNLSGSGTSSSTKSVTPLQNAFDAIQTIPTDGTPAKVQITDKSGTEIGTSIASGIQQVSDGMGQVTQGQSDAKDATKKAANQTASDPLSAEMQKFLKSQGGKITMGALGAYSGYEMATAPGGNFMTSLAGAATTYASVASMFSGGAAASGGAGPYVAAAVALFTLLSHHDDPQKMPDKYNTQAWGTTLANLIGAGFNGVPQWGANGQAFSEDATLNQALGNKGELSYISDWIAANPQEAAKLLGPAAVSLFSGAHTVVNGKDGNLTLDNGQTVNWQTLGNAAAQATDAIQKMGTNALGASANADRLAASFTSLILGGPAGFNIPLLLNGMSGSISGGVSSLPGTRRSPNDGPGGAERSTQPIHVHVLEGATITSDIAGEIKKVLPTISSALASVVNRANYQQQRLYGDYVSSVS